ncbi:uncharacterized protein DKFZp434B061-like isoform X2 [Panicum virgatum]|uniref:uncharacterized protein DKFZp434B061-like isoform X2 n=1 Tax=Panicum virgatum TaxID=38727 RepID=UPI0019D6806A|nr:uncharacterized protein DKFZp434B061-like isoform X2 [Panicum virgatum]
MIVYLAQELVRACSTCQRNKTQRPAGLLQPLEVHSQVWADISMDFVEGLPKVGGKSVILTGVDCFSKYAHFIALSHLYTASSVARTFFDGIVRLHGFPTSIVSDRDPESSRATCGATCSRWPASSSASARHFILRRTTSRRSSTRCWPCTCDAPRETAREPGWTGSRRQSTATTPRTTRRFGRRRSRWSTSGPRRRSNHTPPARPRRTRPTRFSVTVTPSSPTSASVFSRLVSTPSTTTTFTAASWSLRWVIGSGSACYTGRPTRWSVVPRESSGKLGPRYAGLFQVIERIG